MEDYCVICEHPAHLHFGPGCHKTSLLRGTCECTFVKQSPLPEDASAEQYRQRADWWKARVRVTDDHIRRAHSGSERRRRLEAFRENAHSAAKRSMEMAELTEAKVERERAERDAAVAAAAATAHESSVEGRHQGFLDDITISNIESQSLAFLELLQEQFDESSDAERASVSARVEQEFDSLEPARKRELLEDMSSRDFLEHLGVVSRWTVSIGQGYGGSPSPDTAATPTPSGSPVWLEPDLGGAYVGVGDDRPRGRAELMPGLDPGLTAVRFTYDALRMDRQWTVVEERGFTWWGHRLATHVWSEPGFDDDGIEIFRLMARTPVLRDVSDSEFVTRLLDAGNGMAVTSALLHDREAGTIDYVASQWVHPDSLAWAALLFSTVVAMQAAEAHTRAMLLAPLLDAEPAYSGHRETGDREEPDEMLGLLELVSAHGRQPSTWAGQEMLDALDLIRRSPGVTKAAGDGATIMLELDGGGHPCLVQVSAQAPHPALGNGLLVRSSIEPREGLDASWAARMNQRELEVVNPAMFYGAWVGSGERPTFVAFYPNYLANSGVGVSNVVLSAVNRAVWAAALGAKDEGAGASKSYFLTTGADGLDPDSEAISIALALESGVAAQSDGAGILVTTTVEGVDPYEWPARVFEVEPIGSLIEDKRAGWYRADSVRVVRELLPSLAFGPNGSMVAAMLDLTTTVTPELAASRHPQPQDPGLIRFAWHQARDAAESTNRLTAFNAALSVAAETADRAAGSVSVSLTPVGDAAQYAASALVVRDLIDSSLFAVLYGAWYDLMGPAAAVEGDSL